MGVTGQAQVSYRHCKPLTSRQRVAVSSARLNRLPNPQPRSPPKARPGSECHLPTERSLRPSISTVPAENRVVAIDSPASPRQHPATNQRQPLTTSGQRGDGLTANWHVRPEDQDRLRAELAALDARLHELDQRLWEAIHRQRYSRTPEDIVRAADDLKHLVTEMDRLMTRSRAVEGKLLLLQKLAPKPADPGRNPGASSSDASERLAIEVYREPPGTKMNG